MWGVVEDMLGVTSIPKNFEVVIGELGGIKRGVRRREGEGLSGEPVHKICRSVKGLNLVDGGRLT